MKKLIKKIKDLLCRHKEVEISQVTKRKCKLKKGVKEAKTLYDVYEVVRCTKCGTQLNKRKIKHNLTGNRLIAYYKWLKANRGAQ